MIDLRFRIKNPLLRIDNWVSICTYAKTITNTKTLNFQIYVYGFYLFELGVDLSWTGKDHAGPSLELNLFGFGMMIELNDNRHWNYEKDRWYFDNEEQ